MEEFVAYRKEQESTLASLRVSFETEMHEMGERLEDREEAVQRVAERLRRRELELESVRKDLEQMSSMCQRREDESRRLQETLDIERCNHGIVTKYKFNSKAGNGALLRLDCAL